MEHARRRASLIHPDSHGPIGPHSPVCACFGQNWFTIHRAISQKSSKLIKKKTRSYPPLQGLYSTEDDMKLK
jgi:hypothetical protein